VAANVNVRMPDDLHAWATARAAHEGISAGQLVRQVLSAYRAASDPTHTTHIENEETLMPRPKSSFNTMAISPKRKRAGKYSADRPLQESERVRPPQATCSACGTETWTDADGYPRPHLRDARPGDLGYSELVPTKSPCEGAGDE
jgi:hypothetical protein